LIRLRSEEGEERRREEAGKRLKDKKLIF